MLFKNLAVGLLVDQTGQELFTISKQALFPTTINFGISKYYTCLLRKSMYGHNFASMRVVGLYQYLDTRETELHYKEFREHWRDLAVATEPEKQEYNAR